MFKWPYQKWFRGFATFENLLWDRFIDNTDLRGPTGRNKYCIYSPYCLIGPTILV